VTEATWSRYGGEDCIRVAGLAADAEVRVRPRTAVVVGELPPMAGRLVRDEGDVCFVPRFAFVDGTPYTVLVDGAAAAVLVRPRAERPATTEVLEIQPTATEVPRNLLRLYVSFSAPMSEGDAVRHVRLVDDDGDPLTGALLPTEHELWDAGRRRLTVLLDPARIKRGLVAHRQIGYPLQPGVPFRVVVDAGFRDAAGSPLRAGGERRYEVGDEEHRRVEPDRWAVTAPPSHTVEPIVVTFDRPLDHGLLARCLRVVGPDGELVDGTRAVGAQGRDWRMTPRSAWTPAAHQLVVDPILEDLAGNSIRRIFDRDLTRPDQDPGGAGPVTLTFRPR
jgi:hypothetical protein